MGRTVAFLSHNKNDAAAAREVGVVLASAGVGVWFDEWRVRAGDSLPERIAAGLRQCSHLLLLWSRNAESSPWVRRELNAVLPRMIKSGRPRVVPVTLDDTPLLALIADLRYVRFIPGDVKSADYLIAEILGHAPKQSFIRALVTKYYDTLVVDDPDSQVDFRACPKCGAPEVSREKFFDLNRRNPRYVFACAECGWHTVIRAVSSGFSTPRRLHRGRA